MNRIKAIAFYLPQYHPIPENDEWWGKGFTEWTNVTKASPLFPGHYQPNLPSEFGFYDLRVKETRVAQADLARDYGIYGFCYWHYWFGNGKRILQRPFEEVLSSKEPDFPFCLAWANETWSGVWHGLKDKILIKQEYPGIDDYIEHFKVVKTAFNDPRYIRVNGKPLFIVYHPNDIPDLKEFVSVWRQMSKKEGFEDLFLLGIENESWDYKENLFDGRIEWTATNLLKNYSSEIKSSFNARFLNKVWNKIFKTSFPGYRRPFSERPVCYDYERAVELYDSSHYFRGNFPAVITNWDNTPRSGLNGMVFLNDNPENYGKWLKKACKKIELFPEGEQFVFIKSWNEWAEGNYMEPSVKHGRGYLEITKAIIEEFNGR